MTGLVLRAALVVLAGLVAGVAGRSRRSGLSRRRDADELARIETYGPDLDVASRALSLVGYGIGHAVLLVGFVMAGSSLLWWGFR